MSTPLPLAAQLREDWETHSRRTMLPGLHALAVHRLGTWGEQQDGPVRLLVKVVYTLLNNLLVRNVYGVEIDTDTVIGRRVRLGHHAGVVLGGTIGDDVLIRQNVTLGVAVEGGGTPRIGNGVELGAGAIVVGEVTVGDGARVGPGAVVMTDVAPGAVAFAPTARVLKARTPDAQS